MTTLTPTQAAVTCWDVEQAIQLAKITYDGPSLAVAQCEVERTRAAYANAPWDDTAAESYREALIACERAIAHQAALRRFERQRDELMAAAGGRREWAGAV